MLRGTVYEGFTPEHLPTLLQASKDFYESEADYPCVWHDYLTQ